MEHAITRCLVEMGLYKGFTLQMLLEAIETTFGRKIHCIPFKMPSGIFGAWVTHKTLAHEIVAYDEMLPRWHQRFVILHEISHFLLGHKSGTIEDLEEFVHKLQTKNMRFRAMLNRNDQEEIEAETCALYLHSLMADEGVVNIVSSDYLASIGVTT